VGLTGGYSTFLGLDIEARRAVVVLTNSGLNNIDYVGFHLLDPAVPLRSRGAEVARSRLSARIHATALRLATSRKNDALIDGRMVKDCPGFGTWTLDLSLEARHHPRSTIAAALMTDTMCQPRWHRSDIISVSCFSEP
jgi:hypothetical protein